MYALVRKPVELCVIFYCQECEENFTAKDSAKHCPYCNSQERNNLVILHLEENEERAQYLQMVDFSAGD